MEELELELYNQVGSINKLMKEWGLYTVTSN